MFREKILTERGKPLGEVVEEEEHDTQKR